MYKYSIIWEKHRCNNGAFTVFATTKARHGPIFTVHSNGMHGFKWHPKRFSSPSSSEEHQASPRKKEKISCDKVV